MSAMANDNGKKVSENKKVTACLIVIGNEILSGRTQDANIQYLGGALNDLGVRLQEVRVIPDIERVIVYTINATRRGYNYVLTTGGIGPTHDDITSISVAKTFGRRLIRDPQAESWLFDHYKPEDRTPERMKMADVPEGSILIENPVSKAPGFQVENVFVLPGVPRIMQAMFEGIRDRFSGGDPVLSRSVWAFVLEGELAGGVAIIQKDHPETDIGSYPFVRDGKVGASIVVRSTDEAALDSVVNAVAELMRGVGGEPIEDVG